MNFPRNGQGQIQRPQVPAIINPQKTLGNHIRAMKDQIAMAIPRHIHPDSMLRAFLTAVSQNEKLAECTLESFMGAMMQCAQLGLEPNNSLGHAYLIPYKDKCTFVTGYMGYIALANRTDKYKWIAGEVVYDNDHFKEILGMNRDLDHVRALQPSGTIAKYYGSYKLINGGGNFLVKSKQEIIAHMEQYSPGHKKPSSPWKTSFDAMAMKTCLRLLLKKAPLSTAIQQAVSNDGLVLNAELSEGQINIVPEEFETEKPDELPSENMQNRVQGATSNDLQAMQQAVAPRAQPAQPSAQPQSATTGNQPEILGATKAQPAQPATAEEMMKAIEKYKDEHTAEYETVTKYLMHDKVSAGSELAQKLEDLSHLKLVKGDKGKITTAVRTALAGDFKALDKILETREGF